jgi:hypothetical protein
MKNPCLEAALSELAKVGIRDVKRSFGGKHLQIRFKSNGSERMYVMPLTPSDVRSAANTRADIRRILREDGLLLTTERRPPAPRPPAQGTRVMSSESRSSRRRAASFPRTSRCALTARSTLMAPPV